MSRLVDGRPGTRLVKESLDTSFGGGLIMLAIGWWLLCAAGSLALFGTIVWVAWHFISKFW
jgi:hypothetical protein